MVFASRSKRSRNCAFCASSAHKTFTATLRLSRVSRAFHTSPIPPAPRRVRISYGPSRAPGAMIMGHEKYISAVLSSSASPLVFLRRPSRQMPALVLTTGALILNAYPSILLRARRIACARGSPENGCLLDSKIGSATAASHLTPHAISTSASHFVVEGLAPRLLRRRLLGSWRSAGSLLPVET